MTPYDTPARAVLAAIVEGGATGVALLASLAAILTALTGGAVSVYMMRSNRRRMDAEAAHLASQAGHVDRETQFTGTIYIKDLSEAAASIVATTRGENKELQARVEVLESRLDTARDRIEALEADNQRLARELHRAQERITEDQDNFQRQMRALMLRYGVTHAEDPDTGRSVS